MGITWLWLICNCHASELPVALDRPFAGIIDLAVDARDTDHQVFSIHETIPVQRSGDTTLLYPQWELASHAPTASIANLAGLAVHINGAVAEWQRDSLNMYAFHVNVPEGSRSITLDFEWLGPLTGRLLRSNLAKIPWQSLLLYPAGWFARDIAVAATLALPAGLEPMSSLTSHRDQTGTIRFDPVSLDMLIDAPVYAGRYTRQIPLTSGANPVKLDLLADEAKDLALSDAEIARMKALITEALKIFGPPPYNLPAAYFSNVAGQLDNRDLIAHEFVHAWNGMWRIPQDLWSPAFNQAVSGSLLWVYEGQTEFWGRVLAARAGLRDRQQTLDKLALDAALVGDRQGRLWKNLRDSTNDAIYMAGHRVQWRDWQRREDYYPEGVMLWLDVDARLRQLTHGQLGLDEFAQRLFKVAGHDQHERTYDFQNVCDTLNSVASDDWAAFLNHHLDTHDANEALAGLARSGWQLTFSAVPTEAFRQNEVDADAANFDYSIGLQIDANGKIPEVRWHGPAFDAGLSPGSRVLEVNGTPFSTAALTSAVRVSPQMQVTLRVDTGDAIRSVELAYRGGLRYPHLERVSGSPDWLSVVLRSQAASAASRVSGS